MFGDPHFWERALMWVTGQEEERSAEKRKREEEEARASANILTEPIIVHDEIERLDRRDGRLPKETFADRARKYGNLDRTYVEDRRGENPAHDTTPVGAPPPPRGWPNGWEHTYDPRWINDQGVAGKLRPDLPPDVLQGMDEAYEFNRLREEDGFVDDKIYEPTDSPMVLRKRNPNGTITHVHALTGQPLFDEGLYGMNDPQGAEPGDPDPYDPYWRAGRREW